MPDKGKTEFVYDADDRLVASRDAQESADGRWRFYRYDRTGREVYMGLVTKSSSAATLRSSYANKAFHETRSGTGAVAGYTSGDTVIPVTESDVLTVTYYDSYGYPDAKAYVAAGKEEQTVGGTTTTVTYIYDASGNKLAVSQNGTAKNYYCGDFVYHGSLAVAYILTPNGQLTRDPSTGTYTSQYNIPDHLGNVRAVVSSSGTVLQSTDYYPFGLAFADANVADNHLGRPFLIFRQIGARGSVIEGAWRPMDVRQQLKSGYGAHRHS